jgi:type III secretion protein J
MRVRGSFLCLLSLAWLLTSCVGKQEIVSGIGEKEANEIVVFLAAHGIPATKVAVSVTGAAAAGAGAETTFNVEVPSGQAVEALAILNRNGLPRRPVNSLLQIFAKSGLVSSAQEEQIRYQEGLSTQIAGVIRKIDGVIDADVQISFPATEAGAAGGAAPEQAPGEVRASVYVKHSGILDDPNSQLVNKIKRLVAGSVVGLTFDNVTVVTDRARFSEVAIPGTPEQIAQHEWESVWGIVMSKASVGRFQALFTILCVILLLLALALGWFIWKLYPLVQRGGGVVALFNSWRPLEIKGETVQPPPKPPTEESP